MAVTKIDPAISSVLFKPVLIRAGVSLIFAAVAFIIQEPSHAVTSFGVAIYLMLSGTALWEYLRREPVPEAMRSPLSMACAAWCLGAIVVVGVHLFEAPMWATAVAVGAAYLVGGVAELVAGVRHRKDFIPARDQILAGGVNTLAGLGLIIWSTTFNDHQVMGLTGTVAFIITVITAVAGIGFWLDARAAAKAGHTEAKKQTGLR